METVRRRPRSERAWEIVCRAAWRAQGAIASRTIDGLARELQDALPSPAFGRVLLCKAALAEGDAPTALWQAQEAVRLDPGSANALHHLAQARATAGDLWDAVDVYEELLRRDPDDRLAAGGAVEVVQRILRITRSEIGALAWTIFFPTAILGLAIFRYRKRRLVRRDLPPGVRTVVVENARRRRARSAAWPLGAAACLTAAAFYLAEADTEPDPVGFRVTGILAAVAGLALLTGWLRAWRRVRRAERADVAEQRADVAERRRVLRRPS
jgi:cytochrome c-type biogenesis protein CcmH/NrfG